MRLAFVDLLFSWPPHGGADVDLYHVVQGIQSAGHEVQVFGVRSDLSWERGDFVAEELPFPAVVVDLGGRVPDRKHLPAQLREAVDAWRPDAVFVCDGFLLKPYVINALAQYPLVARYYAYEAVCQRDILHFKDGQPCPNLYPTTPDACRRCALEHLGPEIRRGVGLSWVQEYLGARAYAPGYHQVLLDALGNLEAAIVYNERMGGQLAPYCRDVAVVPGGVDPAQFPFAEVPSRGQEDRKIILMAGRAEDPAKGLATLLEAGELLRRERGDFEIQATLPVDDPGPEWLHPLGWCPHEKIKALYATCDVCVAPSIWEEPFGIVALEAMATGRPVCASRVGGLQEIVHHGETGLLFSAGDGAGLARHLATLLDDAVLRSRMGAAGRRLVEQEYDWRVIVERHYLPLIARLGQSGKGAQA